MPGEEGSRHLTHREDAIRGGQTGLFLMDELRLQDRIALQPRMGVLQLDRRQAVDFVEESCPQRGPGADNRIALKNRAEMNQVEGLPAQQRQQLGAKRKHPADEVVVGTAKDDLAHSLSEGANRNVRGPGRHQHQRAETAAEGASVGLDVRTRPLGGGRLIEADV